MELLLQQFANGLVIGGVYTLLGLGLSLVYVIVRIINFAHGELIALGAITTFVLNSQLEMPYLVGVVAAVLVAVLAAMLIEQVAVRPLWNSPRITSLIATIGISLIITQLGLLVVGPNPHFFRVPLAGEILHLGPIRISALRVLVLAMAILTVAAVSYFMYRTRLGLSLRALMDDTVASQLVGVNPKRAALLAFALGGAAAGLTGGLMAPLLLVHPQMGLHATLIAFAVIVLGGLGNLWGTIVSGPVIGLIEGFSAALLPSGFQNILIFAVMILSLVLFPEGIVGRSRSL